MSLSIFGDSSFLTKDIIINNLLSEVMEVNIGLSSYLTSEEKIQITALKNEMLNATSESEVRYNEKLIHNILDIAQERYKNRVRENEIPMFNV
ncbi:hypothetical protein FVO58_25650 [Metabacillus halosaccharovorans]|nr:hypothetical protein [Metabacillus halosaccharovorans]